MGVEMNEPLPVEELESLEQTLSAFQRVCPWADRILVNRDARVDSGDPLIEVIETFSVYPTVTEVNGIGKVKKTVRAFALTVAVNHPGNRDEPPSSDEKELGVHRCIWGALREMAELWLREELNTAAENDYYRKQAEEESDEE